MRLFTLNIGFDKDSLHLTYIRESFDLVVSNRSHQSSLSTIVRSKKTVVSSTEKLHFGVVKKNLCTIRKSEGTIAQFLCIIVVVIIIRNFHSLLALDSNFFNYFLRSGLIG